MQMDIAVQSMMYQFITPLAAPQEVAPPTAIPQNGPQGVSRFGPAVVLEISPEGRAAYEASIKGEGEAAPGAAGVEGPKECETCKNRKYVDGSDDPSVSFQTPTHINPESAMTAVAAHEGEHVRNEQLKADQEGRKVISQSVSIHTSVCPECGRVYVSGGQTRTVTAPDEKPDMLDKKNKQDGEKDDTKPAKAA